MQLSFATLLHIQILRAQSPYKELVVSRSEGGLLQFRTQLPWSLNLFKMFTGDGKNYYRKIRKLRKRYRRGYLPHKTPEQLLTAAAQRAGRGNRLAGVMVPELVISNSFLRTHGEQPHARKP
jgi:hypothetical protein